MQLKKFEKKFRQVEILLMKVINCIRKIKEDLILRIFFINNNIEHILQTNILGFPTNYEMKSESSVYICCF